MALKIGEEEGRFWDLLLKAIGGLIAIVTVWTGLQAINRQTDQIKVQQQQLAAQQAQFEATRREQAKTMEEEYHRRFWEKKLDVYMRLCHAASSLALAQHDSDEYKQANHELMLIYGGEFQVVASPEVKNAFGEFLTASSSSSLPFLKAGPEAGIAQLSRARAKHSRAEKSSLSDPISIDHSRRWL
jgi:hypothetical protein